MKRNRDIHKVVRVSILLVWKHSIDFMARTVEPLNPLKEHRHALRQAKFETVCTLRRYAFIPHLCVWRARRAFDTPYVMHLAHSRGLSPPRIGLSDGMPEVSIFLSRRRKSRDYNPPCNKIGDKP